MDKKNIIKFLKAKKRGIYTIIVDVYSERISNTGAAMALEIIKEDLQRDSEEEIELNYFSLAQAIAKSRKPSSEPITETKKKWEFKDSHELKKNEDPGKFKLD